MRFSTRSIVGIPMIVLTLACVFLLSGLLIHGVPTHAASAPHQTITKGLLTPSTTVDSADSSATLPRGVRHIHARNSQAPQSPTIAGSQLTGDSGALLQNFNGTSSLDSELRACYSRALRRLTIPC